MRESRIIVEPIAFISIAQCHIYKCINEHFTAYVAGYVADSFDDEQIFRCSENTEINILIYSESNNTQSVFKGVIKTISLISEGGLKKVVIEAISYSSLIDKQYKIRTFQNENQAYKDIFDFISLRNQDSIFIYTADVKKKTGKMLVQYNETDWEFLKRLASRLNTVLVPDCRNSNVCLCIGLPRRTAETLGDDVLSCKVEKRVADFVLKNVHNVNIHEQDVTDYIIESREIKDLCTPIIFQDKQLYIYEISSQLHGSELIHTYRLCTKDAFKTICCSNAKIIGTSILGTVLDVQYDKVKVKIDSDDDRPDGIGKWFDYSTVYSSPDGEGWYCMPEKGDKIRVYFPNDEENDAYVISAVHLGHVSDMREHPDEKSIRTIYDKEIRLTPTKILITNHKGISITLDDKKGIIITSKKDITMTAAQNISISSVGGSVTAVAEEGISLQQNGNSLIICNGIREYGLNIQRQ